jgi:hypothetical protein
MKINIVGQRKVRYVIFLGVGIFRSELQVRNVKLTKGRDISLFHCVKTCSEAFEQPNH